MALEASMPESNTTPDPQSPPPASPKSKALVYALLLMGGILGMIVGATIGGIVGYAIDEAPTPIPYWGFPYNQYGLKAGVGAWAGAMLGGFTVPLIIGIVVRTRSSK
jgi:hypothetical protein